MKKFLKLTPLCLAFLSDFSLSQNLSNISGQLGVSESEIKKLLDAGCGTDKYNGSGDYVLCAKYLAQIADNEVKENYKAAEEENVSGLSDPNEVSRIRSLFSNSENEWRKYASGWCKLKVSLVYSAASESYAEAFYGCLAGEAKAKVAAIKSISAI